MLFHEIFKRDLSILFPFLPFVPPYAPLVFFGLLLTCWVCLPGYNRSEAGRQHDRCILKLPPFVDARCLPPLTSWWLQKWQFTQRQQFLISVSEIYGEASNVWFEIVSRSLWLGLFESYVDVLYCRLFPTHACGWFFHLNTFSLTPWKLWPATSVEFQRTKF